MFDANPWIENQSIALFTDLYELTMLQAYFEQGMHDIATFSLFVRRLPNRRNYLLACGMDDVLTYLEAMRFEQSSLDYLASLGCFTDPFLKWLANLRFSGEVTAVPEGMPVFADEPILEVTAPLPQAQIAETFIINQVHLQTTLASKASRVVTAARGRAVIDFGARRMHGTDAALKAARAFYIAGVVATSNVLAGRVYGIPVAGTMAHSFVQAWDSEQDALRCFAQLYPRTVLLVDTYDTLKGVARVCELARELGNGFTVRAVRLDSGDLAGLAFQVRKMLDDAGLGSVEIFASSGLDEAKIDDLVRIEAPITGFGVGTKMGVSEDAPSLDIAYKLSAYAGKGRLKLSAGKPILPGRKQVFRIENNGYAVRDIIAGAEENIDGRPLLRYVMRNGRRLGAAEDLNEARQRARDELSILPEYIRALPPAHPPYPVVISPRLRTYRDEVIARLVT